MLTTILKAFAQRGYKLLTRPFELNIVGIRSNYNKPNVFDDSIHVLFTDGTGCTCTCAHW